MTVPAEACASTINVLGNKQSKRGGASCTQLVRSDTPLHSCRANARYLGAVATMAEKQFDSAIDLMTAMGNPGRTLDRRLPTRLSLARRGGRNSPEDGRA